MATYSYRCVACKNTFDVTKRMQEASRPETCPDCDYPAERVFTVPQGSVPGGTPTHHRR